MYKIITIFSLIIFSITRLCYSEKIRFIATEHPVTSKINYKHVRYANLTSRRYSRADPYYYVGVNFEAIYEFHNNVSVDFYFYEFLTNRYRRGFVEMHFRLCDLVESDKFFGTALRQGKLVKPCPFPAGVYNLSNMTIPIKYIPHNFPFTKGRIYANFSVTASKELIVSGYVDMEVKEIRTNKIPWVDSKT